MLHLKDFFNETTLDEFLKGKWSGTAYHFADGKQTTTPATFEMKRRVAVGMCKAIMVEVSSGEEVFIWLNSVELAVIDREESQLMLQIQSRTGQPYDVLVQSEMESLEDLYFLLDILRDPNTAQHLLVPVPGYGHNPISMSAGFPGANHYAGMPTPPSQGFSQNPTGYGQNPNGGDVNW